jgi:K+-transporting ATPase A subunit
MMNANGWVQLALLVTALAVITKPMGSHLIRVLDANGKTWFDPILRRLERFTYRAMGVNPEHEHDWKQYTLAMLGFSAVGCLFTYAILLLPICLVFAVCLVSQGMIQNFQPYTQATTLEGATQTIVQGPMASQAAIKMLGTNGGGYANANANAAHPFENPTPLSNFLQMLSIFSMGSGLTHYLGRMTRNPAHGWSVWSAMMALFLAGVLACWWAESAGNPIHQQLGLVVTDGNMERKEVRFGLFNSALFATITTDASCGAVNAMHDSFTPLGGFVPLFNIQLGEIIFGGVGAGPRQDGHHHPGQSHGFGVSARSRHLHGATRRRRAACLTGGRNPGRP